jgi:hypothetical protein
MVLLCCDGCLLEEEEMGWELARTKVTWPKLRRHTEKRVADVFRMGRDTARGNRGWQP